MNRKILTGIVTSLLTAAPAFAETPVYGSVELMAGKKSATLDTKLCIPIVSRLSLFNRNLFTGIYKNGEEGSLSSFHIFTLNYNIVGGLDFFTETDLDFPAGGLDPRAGLQHFKELGDFGIFTYSSFSPKGVNVLFINEISYNHMFTKMVGLTGNVEVLFDLGEKSFNFSTERLRLGANLGGYKLGPAADFNLNQSTNQNIKETTFSYNLGGFVKKDF